MRIIAASILALMVTMPAAEAVTVFDITKVCKFDIDQYCKGIRRTRIRDLRECLGKHEKDLFPQCQDHYKEAK